MSTKSHQAIVFHFARHLSAFVDSAKLGSVFTAPLRVKICNGKFREPDVIFLKTERVAMGTDEYCVGTDLVMEVVRGNYRNHDLQTKRFEYARSGIPEYWIVDPMLKQITVLKLTDDTYEVATEIRTGLASSSLLEGFVVDVGAVF